MPTTKKEKQTPVPLATSNNPWVEAPYATVPITQEDGQQVTDFMVRSARGARQRDDRLGRRHRGNVVIYEQERHAPLSPAELQVRRRVATKNRKAKAVRRGAIGLVASGVVAAALVAGKKNSSGSHNPNTATPAAETQLGSDGDILHLNHTAEGDTVTFRKTVNGVDIDHTVPVSELTPAEREALAQQQSYDSGGQGTATNISG